LPYLLDTNTVSYVMQRRPTIVAKVTEAGGVNNLAVTAITVAELRYGVEAMPEGRRKQDRLASINTILEGLEVRAFTQDAGAAFGWAAALLEKGGVAWDWPDLAIASVALAEHMTVASNDSFFGHVERVCGLRFERWEP
jgi:predicted nucleic acid-binding protein